MTRLEYPLLLLRSGVGYDAFGCVGGAASAVEIKLARYRVVFQFPLVCVLVMGSPPPRGIVLPTFSISDKVRLQVHGRNKNSGEARMG